MSKGPLLWTIIDMNFRVFAVMVAVTSANPALAQPFDLLGHWRQAASSAGDCPNCAISITAKGDRFEVTASNGWSAEIAPTSRAGEKTAVGVGKWPSWEERAVRVFLLLDDDDNLIMQMAIRHPDMDDQIIHAVFRRDPST